MASTTTTPIQSGLQEQAQLVAGQQPAIMQVPQQQQQPAPVHRILRIAVDGTINDPKSVWWFTTASGTNKFTCCELMVMSPSTKTFTGRATLDEPITVETLNTACATDFYGTQNYFFVVRIHSHYVLLQPPQYMCANVGSFPPTSKIREAARYLGEDLLWFAFKSYSGALEGGITQIYHSRTPPNAITVHQSNKQLVRLISAAGALIEYTGVVDPAFYTPPPYVPIAAVPPQQPPMTLAAAADALLMPPPPASVPTSGKQRALSNAKRRSAQIVVDATIEAAKIARRVKKAQQFNVASKTTTAQRMMLSNNMPVDMAINGDMIRRMTIADPTSVTFNLSLSADECQAYVDTLLVSATHVPNERIEVQFRGNEKVEFDLRALQSSSIGGVRVSVPNSWVPSNVQTEMIRIPKLKMEIEIEMLRVIRSHVASKFPFAPEYHDSMVAVDDNAPQLGYKTFDGRVGVELRDTLARAAGVAPTLQTVRTRNLVAQKPIAKQEQFMGCPEGRIVQFSEIIGMQLGLMLFGLEKLESLPTNFSTWSFENLPYLVQFGAVNDPTLEDGSLIVYAGQCSTNMQPNARVEVTNVANDTDKRAGVCLVALTDIAAGETICIDRGDWIVKELYPALTGQQMPALRSTSSASSSSTSSVDSPQQQPTSALFSALGEIASEQFDEEVVLFQSANSTTTATTTTAAPTTTVDNVVLANNLDDDDDDNDDNEKVEDSMRSESARLATLSIIQEDLQRSSILRSTTTTNTSGSKRYFKNNDDDDDSNNDVALSSTDQRLKMRRYNFMLSQDDASTKSRASIPAGTPKKRKSIFARNDTDSIEVSVVLP